MPEHSRTGTKLKCWNSPEKGTNFYSENQAKHFLYMNSPLNTLNISALKLKKFINVLFYLTLLYVYA